MKRLPALATALVVGIAMGILFEHYVGAAAIIDWSGLRHSTLIGQLRSTAHRVEIPLDALQGKPRMVALVFGQSNAANSGETLAKGSPGVYEFYRGRLYEAQDPLLGADGSGGTVWIRLAAKAVASGDFHTVVLVPFAFSTTEIARWAPGGSLHDALLQTIRQAQASGLRFTHLLWHQGEADAQRRTPDASYRERLLAMVMAIRGLGVDAPVYVATASRCGKVRGYEPIRNAQTTVINPSLGILPGPDTDTLGWADRYDGCHFSTEGLEKAASLWWDSIRGTPAGR